MVNKHNKILFILFIIILNYQYLFTNSQVLDHIIKLGDHPYRYNHFSINSEGDLIIDTESYPLEKIRKFYGIKKNGKEFFTDNNNKPNYYSSISLDNGRIEGESCFVKVKTSTTVNNWKEYLFGVSKGELSYFYTEFYDLNSGTGYNINIKSNLGDIRNNVFSFIPHPKNSDSEFNYFISYVAKISDSEYRFYIKSINFYYYRASNKGINITDYFNCLVKTQTIISCFFTKNRLYNCLYTKSDSKLVINVYNPSSKMYKENVIYTYTEEYERRFQKGILLRENIGFFAFYKTTGGMPCFSLYKINIAKTISIYNSYYEITPVQSTYYNFDMLNDIITFNNNTICFVSSSNDKLKLNILVFSLYDNDNYMNIRYFLVNIWEENNIKFYCELKLNIFKDFLLMAFSNCEEEDCDEYGEGKHLSSLIFFNYANSSEIDFDVLEYIYPTNKNIQNDMFINFEEKLLIENNIFGYILKGTKIINHSNDIKLLKNGVTIELGTIIDKGENVQLKSNTDVDYYKGNYTIEFAYVLTEPDYGTNNNYMTYINSTYGNDKKEEKEFFEKNEYTGKSSNFIAILSKSLTHTCENDLCSLCYIDGKDICVTCLYNFDYNETTKIKTCHNFETQNIIVTSEVSIPDTFESQFNEKAMTPTFKIQTTEKLSEKNMISFSTDIKTNITELIEKMDNISLCPIDEILLGNCHRRLNTEETKKIYEKLQKQISANSTRIISAENIIYQISSLHEQQNDDSEISSIYLGECEQIIKDEYNLTDDEDLIVLKTDIKNDDLTMTFVQYEVYNPRNLKIISLEPCKNTSIIIKVPVNLNERTEIIYDSLSQSGYNLFDLNDDFYNDICSTYTTENGTDVTLADRKNTIYNLNANVTLCQEGCQFQLYNSTTKKSQCDCLVQTQETKTNITEINFGTPSLKDEFFNTLNNSNFRVLKCYKLVFSKKGQKNNIGSYIMSCLCLIYIILLLVFIFKHRSQTKKFIDKILEQKLNYSHKKEKNKNKSDSKFKEKLKDKKIITEKSTKKYKKRKKKKKTSFPPRKRKAKLRDDMNKYQKSFDTSLTKQSRKNINILSENKINHPKKNVLNLINIINVKNLSNKKKDYIYKLTGTAQDFPDNKNIFDLNEQEMNYLEYDIALLIDKRTYCQYYFSLLKKKQLILFAFYPNNDYNLAEAKISLFILSFSLYFTVNGFFFSDSTMNKIDIDHGKYDFLFQIPHALYSTIISAVINLALKLLSLSEKDILNIKKENDYFKAKKKSKLTLKCLRAKLIIFFILSLFLMLFFWYFISCFCAVYKNTQKILIFDTMVSFIITMIYPFGLNLLPGFFRIPALKDKDKNKKYLYVLSTYISYI